LPSCSFRVIKEQRSCEVSKPGFLSQFFLIPFSETFVQKQTKPADSVLFFLNSSPFKSNHYLDTPCIQKSKFG